jgi:tripartite-type tricarboxylate transporter receptor subunit TctC
MPASRFFRCAAGALTLLTLVFGVERAQAQQYPTHRITFVVAFAPGGIADLLARLVAQGVQSKLGQNVVVENRPGAGGNIAATLVSHAAPDGYTVLLTTTALAINLTLHKHNQFSANDLKAVAITASSPEALVANPSNPAKNLAEFVKAAKASGKPINFGSAGVGSGSHLEAAYFFKMLAKVPAQHIPFQGGAPAINALLGNQIDLLATTLGGGAAAQIKAGKLKGLGIAADKRVAVVPDVPTYVEQGFPKFQAASWVGVFAPAKTDPAIVNKLNAAVEDVINDPKVQAKLKSIGFDPIHGSAAQADAFFRSEISKWGEMVKAVGLSLD